MNWFNLAKFGQIWNVKYYRDSVQSCLEALYQLTYKYQQMQIQQFKGHPTRQENMLEGIEKQSRQIISDLVDILLPVFGDWLKGHALTNPKDWASNMLESYEEEGEISPESVVRMIKNFNYGNIGDRQSLSSYQIAEQLDLFIKNKQAPAFADWFYQCKIDIRESHNRDKNDTRTEDELDAYYRDMDFSEFFSTYLGDDWDALFNQVDQLWDIREFAFEIAEFVFFPSWYEYWKQEGIDQTRENVENAYNMIKQVEAQPINQALATINIIINTCHQTGGMLDYIVQATSDHKADLYRAMNNLSSLTHNSPEMKAWNKDLREVGTKIPSPPKPMEIPNDPTLKESTEPRPNTIV